MIASQSKVWRAGGGGAAVGRGATTISVAFPKPEPWDPSRRFPSSMINLMSPSSSSLFAPSLTPSTMYILQRSTQSHDFTVSVTLVKDAVYWHVARHKSPVTVLDVFIESASDTKAIKIPTDVKYGFFTPVEDCRPPLRPYPSYTASCDSLWSRAIVIPRPTLRSFFFAITISCKAPSVVSVCSRSSFRSAVCSDTLTFRSSPRLDAMSCWMSTASWYTWEPTLCEFAWCPIFTSAAARAVVTAVRTCPERSRRWAITSDDALDVVARKVSYSCTACSTSE